MERAALTTSSPPTAVFRDGLGERRHAVDPSGHETLEVLALRNELAAVPSFEFALRERASRLANFRDPAYARVRAVERLSDRDGTLTIVSERVDGVRLASILTDADPRGVPFDINAALNLVRQLLPAVAALHQNARDVAHGALGPERLVVTPDARLVIVEYAAGAALEQLRFSRERYWNELRVALPRTAGLSRFDHRVDVTQVGMVALSLILGRLLADDEYPSRMGDLVASAWAVSAKGGFEPLPPGLRVWLTRALQLDARNAFATVAEAEEDLEKVLRGSEYIASQASLEQFLLRYRAAGEETASPAVPAPSPAPIRTEPVARVESVPVATVSAPSLSAAASTPVVASPVLANLTSESTDFVPESRATADTKEPDLDAPVPITNWSGSRAADDESRDASREDDDASRPSRMKVISIAAALVLLAVTGLVARQFFAGAPATDIATGTLVISTNPEGAAVIVDGEARGKTPTTLSLAAGAHSVELLANGASRTIPITMTAGAEISQYIELPRGASDKGQLQVRTDPAGAQVTVDGTARGVSPTTISDLAPGQHTIVVTSSLGSMRQRVIIEAGATASLFMPLTAPEGAPVSGWISIEAPVDMQLFENGQLLGSSASDRIMVSAGRHEVEVVSETLGYRATRTVQVAAGKVAPLKLDLPKGTLAVNAQPWAEVWIDGEKQGDTPIGNVSLTIGPHSVVFRHPELGEQNHTALVTLKGPARLSVDLRKQ